MSTTPSRLTSGRGDGGRRGARRVRAVAVKAARAVVEQHADQSAAPLARGDQIRPAVGVDVGARDVGGMRGGPVGDAPAKAAVAPAEEDRQRAGAIVGGGKVRLAVAVEVGGDDPKRRLSDGRLHRSAEAGPGGRRGARSPHCGGQKHRDGCNDAAPSHGQGSAVRPPEIKQLMRATSKAATNMRALSMKMTIRSTISGQRARGANKT
jgi:hypothetical protein